MVSVRPALHEPGFLEFLPGDDDRVVYLVKPRVLTLEYIERAPAESFFLLELDEVPPLGVYPERDGEQIEEYPAEEIVEVRPGEYVSRRGWDDGGLPDGRPLPPEARLVVRWLRGKTMSVTKGSIWNGASETYDGRHSRMSASQIRGIIERAIDRAA